MTGVSNPIQVRSHRWRSSRGYTSPGSSVTHLPQEWAAYRGLYLSGNRVVLSYTVGSTSLLESPWFVQDGRHGAFVRTLEIGPSAQRLQMWIADEQSTITLISSHRGARVENGRPFLIVEPHDQTMRVKLLITSPDQDDGVVDRLRSLAGDAENLSELISHDTGRWPEVLTTAGATTATGGPYVIDTITIPFENPFKALFFTSGHDFFSDGTAAVCTVHGDVWTVGGIDRHLKTVQWRRFATGLFQPLGLKIVDDKVYVLGRDQITRLHDRNGRWRSRFL